jgi:hypothetical protein
MYVASSLSETKSEPLKFYQIFMLDKDLKAGSSENYFRAITPLPPCTGPTHNTYGISLFHVWMILDHNVLYDS